MPPITERQRQEKEKNLAIQEKFNADGQKKFEERQREVHDKGKELVEKGIFEGGRNWRESLDFTIHTNFAQPYNGQDRNTKKAKCCRLKKNQVQYKSISYGNGKHEWRYGCAECFGHWEKYKGF